jgi:hypothetical protein
MEEQVGPLAVDRQITDSIDNQQLRLREKLFKRSSSRLSAKARPRVGMSAVALMNKVRTPCR